MVGVCRVRRRRRITLAAVRRLALALPEAVERAHFDVPDFRVWNKIFAALPDGDRAVVVKTDPANADALVSWDGIAFWNEWRGSRVCGWAPPGSLQEFCGSFTPRRLPAARADGVSLH